MKGAIPREQSSPDPGTTRSTVVSETLAAVGGAVLLVGTGLVAARYWPELSELSRLVVVGVAATVLLLGAAAVPARGPSGRRLREALCVLSTAAVSLFLGLLGGEILGWQAIDVVLLTASGVAVYATGLWLWTGRSTALQLVLVAATIVAAGSLAGRLDHPRWPGLAVWATAFLWFVLADRDQLPARELTRAVTAIGMLVGAGMTVPSTGGIALGLLTATALLAHAIRDRSLSLVLIGALGELQMIPIAVTHWLPGRLAVPVALLVGGTGLVGAAILLARRSGEVTDRPQPVIDTSSYDAVLFDLDDLVVDSVDGPHPATGAVALAARLADSDLLVAVISAGHDTTSMLTAAGLDIGDLRIDSGVAQEHQAVVPPDPTLYLLAAHRLGASPRRTALISGASAGLHAGRAASFGLVVGLDPEHRVTDLDQSPADTVVPGLADVHLAALQPAPAQPAAV
ncbi:putative membrane protein DUF2157 [Kribbella amoyensis]|uniref:Putative membrane protein DUF2157 n=1 Tax=Kribbella amoyensis TaxID=996641 RepID=A0A561C0B9_9ACTN|nr:HAD family phosphatase [Kribbella amoyensis]TWD84595.1 putative membrane protein DUF2157 [Kribbella amoyensis]